MKAISLIAGWLFTLTFIVGPYVALLWLLPDVPMWVHLVYWLGMFCYIGLTYDLNPKFDRNNLGLRGTMVDNPFSFEDDKNRQLFYLAVLAIPARLIWATIANTLIVIKGE